MDQYQRLRQGEPCYPASGRTVVHADDIQVLLDKHCVRCHRRAAPRLPESQGG